METNDTQKKTRILVTKETRSKLKQYGIKGETYDQIINKIIDKCDQYCLLKKEV